MKSSNTCYYLLYHIPGCLVKVDYQTELIEFILLEEDEPPRLLIVTWHAWYAKMLINKSRAITQNAYEIKKSWALRLLAHHVGDHSEAVPLAV